MKEERNRVEPGVHRMELSIENGLCVRPETKVLALCEFNSMHLTSTLNKLQHAVRKIAVMRLHVPNRICDRLAGFD